MYEGNRKPLVRDNGSYPHPSELVVEDVEREDQVTKTDLDLGKSGLAPVIEWGPSRGSYRSERLGDSSQL